MTIDESAQQAAALGARFTNHQALLGKIASEMLETIEEFTKVGDGLDEMAELFGSLGATQLSAEASALSNESGEIRVMTESAQYDVTTAAEKLDEAMAMLGGLVERIPGLDSGMM